MTVFFYRSVLLGRGGVLRGDNLCPSETNGLNPSYKKAHQKRIMVEQAASKSAKHYKGIGVEQTLDEQAVVG